MYMVYGIWYMVRRVRVEDGKSGAWSVEHGITYTPALTPHKPFKIKPTALPEMSRPV